MRVSSLAYAVATLPLELSQFWYYLLRKQSLKLGKLSMHCRVEFMKQVLPMLLRPTSPKVLVLKVDSSSLLGSLITVYFYYCRSLRQLGLLLYSFSLLLVVEQVGFQLYPKYFLRQSSSRLYNPPFSYLSLQRSYLLLIGGIQSDFLICELELPQLLLPQVLLPQVLLPQVLLPKVLELGQLQAGLDSDAPQILLLVLMVDRALMLLGITFLRQKSRINININKISKFVSTSSIYLSIDYYYRFITSQYHIIILIEQVDLKANPHFNQLNRKTLIADIYNIIIMEAQNSNSKLNGLRYQLTAFRTKQSYLLFQVGQVLLSVLIIVLALSSKTHFKTTWVVLLEFVLFFSMAFDLLVVRWVSEGQLLDRKTNIFDLILLVVFGSTLLFLVLFSEMDEQQKDYKEFLQTDDVIILVVVIGRYIVQFIRMGFTIRETRINRQVQRQMKKLDLNGENLDHSVHFNMEAENQIRMKMNSKRSTLQEEQELPSLKE